MSAQQRAPSRADFLAMDEDGAEDARYFSSVDIVTTWSFTTLGGERFQREDTLAVSPATLPALVADLRSALAREGIAEPFCIICKATRSRGAHTSAEHFVPEGLGFGWTLLPRGLGTCDHHNRSLSGAELQWLRFGSLGAFRPFFVGSGKDSPPEFHAPRKSKAALSLVRDADGGRVLQIRSDGELGLPDQSEAGRFTVNVACSDSNNTAVSQSVHKLALLSLWLAHREAALDDRLDPLRAFLHEPREDNFCPVTEGMIAGAPPGVRVDLRLAMMEVAQSVPGVARRFELEAVHAGVRAHHMLYLCSLTGDPPAALAEGFAIREWEPPNAPVRVRRVGLSFGFGRMRRA